MRELRPGLWHWQAPASAVGVERAVGPQLSSYAIDDGERLLLSEITERWLRPGVTREEIAAGLRPLLELHVEHVLATHGGPCDREPLERALA